MRRNLLSRKPCVGRVIFPGGLITVVIVQQINSNLILYKKRGDDRTTRTSWKTG